MHCYLRKFCLFIIAALQLTGASASCIQTRYAFDIGSGSAKLGILKVDTCQNKVVSFLKEDSEHVQFQHCIAESKDRKTLSDACIANGVQVIKNLLARNQIDCRNGAKCAGVATAWARNAKNTAKLLHAWRQLGINIAVISQGDEGKFAYQSAILHPTIQEAYDTQEIVIMDVGGGSFQLALETPNNIEIIGGAIGVFNLKKFIDRHLENKPAPPLKHPTYYDRHTLPHAMELAVNLVNSTVHKDKHLTQSEHKKQKRVFAVGMLFVRGLMKQMEFNHIVHKNDLKNTAYMLSDLTEAEATEKFSQMPPSLLPHAQTIMILIYAIMESLAIDQFEVVDARLFDYIALSKKFWE